MKVKLTKLYLKLLCIIICLLPCSLQAEDAKKLVDVRDMLKNADAAKFQNGVTKVIGDQINLKHEFFTKYFYKDANNDNFTYAKIVSGSGNKKNTATTILRPDGNWLLFPGVAIRQPEDMNLPDKAVYHDTKPVLGTTEDCVEDGEPCVRITITPEKHGEEKSVSDNPSFYIYRYGFLISKGSGLIVARRCYSESGKIIYQERTSSVQKNCDFPVSNFEIPKDYRIIFPDNASEYGAVILKCVMALSKQPATNKTNTTSKTTKP